MKKLIYSLIALAGLFTLASCQPDKLIGGPASGNDGFVNATISVVLGPQTKAIADGTTVDKLYAGVYEVSGTGYTWVADNSSAPAEISSKAGTVTFNGKLELGKSYKMVFWAQKEGAPYAIDWAKSVATGPTVTVTATGEANDEVRDAFFGVYETGTVTGSIDLTGSPVTLKRPFAQVNVLVPNANVADLTAAVSSSMTVAQAPTVLNLVTKETSDPADWTFSTAAIDEAAFGSYASSHKYVAMNYVLVAQTGDPRYNVTFSVTCGTQSVADKALANIPLKPNGRTNVVGNIFDASFNITVPIIVGPGADTEQELTTVTVTVGQNSGNAVELDAGYNADPSLRTAIPIEVAVSHPIEDEADKPQITVDPADVATAEWNLTSGKLDVTPLVENGNAVITLVFPAVTKTEYSSATVQIYVKVGTGVNDPQLAAPVLSESKSLTDSRSIWLEWDPIEHADSYTVTYKVKNAEGNPLSISGLANTYFYLGQLPFSTTYTITVQAFADSGYRASNVATIDLSTTEDLGQTVTLTFTPSAGTYYAPQNVTITSVPANAVIHYTLDGTTPTPKSPTYEGPITVSESKTITAIGYEGAYNDSAVVTAEYIIGTPTQLVMSDVTCTAQTVNSLTFSWDAVEHADGYKVSLDGGSSYEETQNTTSYTWTGLSASTTKTIYVKAIGSGAYSDSAAKSADGTTASPTPLEMSAITCSAQTENSLTFSWAAVEHADGYKVSTDGGSTYGDLLTATSYTWTGLSASTTKTIYVKAIGSGAYSDSAAGSASGTTSATAVLSGYSITIDPDAGNGNTIGASKTSGIAEGEEITLTATPASGYVFIAWTVNTAGSGAVTVTNNSFNMPADDVTVTAVFGHKAVLSHSTFSTAGITLSGTATTTEATRTIDGISITYNGVSQNGKNTPSGGSTDDLKPKAGQLVLLKKDGVGVIQNASGLNLLKMVIELTGSSCGATTTHAPLVKSGTASNELSNITLPEATTSSVGLTPASGSTPVETNTFIYEINLSGKNYFQLITAGNQVNVYSITIYYL